MTRAEELANPDLVATFIDRIEDVTELVRNAEDPQAAEADLVAQATDGTGLDAEVVAFDFGNSFYLITTKTYRDVRLVGAPPSAVGKFGGTPTIGYGLATRGFQHVSHLCGREQ